MALLWTTPEIWVAKEPITKERLTAIETNLSYLHAPTREIITLSTGSNQTFTSTSYVDLDPTNYDLSIEITGDAPLLVELEGVISNSTLAALTYLDVMIDNLNYLSSFTVTPVTNGLWRASAFVANHLVPVNLKAYVPAGTLAAGVHTFKPKIKVSAGTTTWYENAYWSQFSVGE